MRDNEATTNFATSTQFEVGDHNGGGNQARRSLFKFDVTSIPSGGIVSAVTLSLLEIDAADGASVSSWPLNMHRFLRDWVEAEATWNIYSTGNDWGTAGGSNATDRSDTVSATVTLDGSAAVDFIDWADAQLITDVQNFVDGGQANYGWFFQAPAAETKGGSRVYNAFRSSDTPSPASHRPKLAITYTVPFTPKAIMF